ncbi:XRE family transcriptional regulator [Sphingobium lactosutens]|uniref:helix-turn-helix domain-containing protein n=1 Tax=Sphingobium lactosutens TaxID=522773 RepID=UPI0015BEF09E|nr:helix-turn-helix transcriptional regulator [Sphingobium lactosutens]NWK96538.1 XRE family transcriptional regulator [Sphingobium lactosutens]
MTPGTYLQLRRKAAGLSIEDVAGAVRTVPHLAEIDRAAFIRLIESDIAAPVWDVIEALSGAFALDRDVVDLLRLAQDFPRHFKAIDLSLPQICKQCGCSDCDPCIVNGRSCAWSAPDLCNACSPSLQEAAHVA